MSLQCDVADERHRVFQDGVLGGNREREIPSLGAARRIRAAIDDRELLHEWRLSTLRQIAVDAGAIDELPYAGSNARLVVDAIGKAEPRLNHSPSLLSRRESVRQSVIHAGKIFEERKFCQCFVERRVSRHHDAVVSIPAHDETACPVHDRCASRIVEVRVEHRERVQLAAPRRPARVAHPGFQREVLRRFPAVLQERVEHRGDEGGVRLGAELGIIVEVSEQHVGD